jgi:hypothetical protein
VGFKVAHPAGPRLERGNRAKRAAGLEFITLKRDFIPLWRDCNVAECCEERYGAPGRTRTCNILIRSQTLYPIELRVLHMETDLIMPQYVLWSMVYRLILGRIPV